MSSVEVLTLLIMLSLGSLLCALASEHIDTASGNRTTSKVIAVILAGLTLLTLVKYLFDVASST